MKQTLKNETDILGLINKIQAQLVGLEAKVDTLIDRSLPAATKPSAIAPVNNTNNNTRVMYKAICADCKKECSIPFKPSGERPVYCQDCFSRRKMIRLSGIKVDDNSQMNIQKPEVKIKKVAVVKKTVAKKKPTPKKK
jgi:CxxC-x17-CxxC domain-containing protein